MKTKFLIALVVSLLAFGSGSLNAQSNTVAIELEALSKKIQDKLKKGQDTEQDLAEELKGFDTLLAKYKGDQSDDVAQVLFLKAILYLQVLDNPEKGKQFITQLKKDFPETKPGRAADQILASIDKQAESKKLRDALKVGATFPDFAEKDLAGKPVSISGYKGKVVLVDFWATWCGPCVAELPNVMKAYEKHHSKGFEIIGISLDEDEAKLNTFIQQKKMTWAQIFDGKGWSNKLAAKYGITSIPSTFLLDGQGKIIAQDLRGEELEKAVAKALASK